MTGPPPFAIEFRGCVSRRTHWTTVRAEPVVSFVVWLPEEVVRLLPLDPDTPLAVDADVEGDVSSVNVESVDQRYSLPLSRGTLKRLRRRDGDSVRVRLRPAE